jgi:cytochrome b561
VHLALYGLMFIIPIFGLVTFIYHGRVFHFGLFDLNFGIKKNPAIFEYGRLKISARSYGFPMVRPSH